MNPNVAKKLVRDTLQESFDKRQFILFLKDLLKNYNEDKARHMRGHVPEGFRPFVKTYERVGTYTTPEDEKVDLLIVYLAKDSSIERARTSLRNFIARHLRQRENKDAALAAFVAPDGEDWRFSFVKMTYEFDKRGKVREIASTHRYSFLVGKNENSHTAQSRLSDILISEDAPTLDALEHAFSIEPVTKEFFEKYRQLFVTVKEALDNIIAGDDKIKTDFAEKGIETANFAKKLLGQIVFLYFLQKKGWFGVPRDKDWGEGDRQFLRSLFDKAQADGKNYFDDYLEPLFYEALRLNRPDDDYFSKFDCKIPFLNGGLFDPMNNYDWVKTEILLPNEIFSNDNRTQAGDEGDGILDIFDRYNFTVKEDEPLEREVAVDPEMLGKVFERLLEVTDRKAKGTYYTPREIVHYMCQQSLTNYLVTELAGSVSKEGIEALIRHGEATMEYNLVREKKKAEREDYKGDYKAAKLPKDVEDHAQQIDEALATIRVLDPAVGSGAFPVGMMNEIVKIRRALTPYLSELADRSPYHFKWQAIRDCLYGVDIDVGAVEIAKLRLWLSLIVDEEERKNIRPLPNLNFKILQGDALSGKEIPLFNENLFIRLENLKDSYFTEINAEKKTKCGSEIKEVIGEITNNHKEFHFRAYFSEVFRKKKGFDVVIGNPPYIQLQKDGGRLGKSLKEMRFKTFTSTGDIYQIFYEKGCKLLAPKSGLLAYITSNSWLKAEYGKTTRNYFAENHTPLRLIDVGKDIFESAYVDASILILREGKSGEACKAVDTDCLPDREFPPAEHLWADLHPQGEKPWTVLSAAERRIMDKIESAGTPLKRWSVSINYGIKTGFNKAFIIDDVARQELVAADPKSGEIIRPILRGQDIQRYQARWANLWLIDTHNGYKDVRAIRSEDYPAVKTHLDKFYPELKKRQDKGKTPYNLRNCAYYGEFLKEKILWSDLVENGRFAYDNSGIYGEATSFIMTGQDIKYLCAVLNSSLIRWFFRQIAPTSGMGVLRWKKVYVEMLPIPKISDKKQKPFIRLVDDILRARAEDPSIDIAEIEAEINRQVYDIYGFNGDEIKIVEGLEMSD